MKQRLSPTLRTDDGRASARAPRPAPRARLDLFATGRRSTRKEAAATAAAAPPRTVYAQELGDRKSQARAGENSTTPSARTAPAAPLTRRRR